MSAGELLEDRTWRDRAECGALPTPEVDRLFFTAAGRREAAKLCRRCPVQVECELEAHRLKDRAAGRMHA